MRHTLSLHTVLLRSTALVGVTVVVVALAPLAAWAAGGAGGASSTNSGTAAGGLGGSGPNGGAGMPGSNGGGAAFGSGGGGGGAGGGVGGQGGTDRGQAGGQGGQTAGANGSDGTSAAANGESGGGGGAGGANGTVGTPVGGTGGTGGRGIDVGTGASGSSGGGGEGGYGVVVSGPAAFAQPVQGGTGGAGGAGNGSGRGGDGGDGGVGLYRASGTTNANGVPITGGTGGAGGSSTSGFRQGGNGGTGGIGFLIAPTTGFTFTNFGVTIQGGIGGTAGTGFGIGATGAGGAGLVGSNLTVSNTGTIAGGLSGDGVTRADAITFTGGTNVLNVGGTLTGTIGDNGGGTLTLNAAAGGSTLANTITGTGSVIKSDANTLSLTNANTYTGGTTISAGVLSISHTSNSTYDGLGAVGSTVTLAGGTLESISDGAYTNYVTSTAANTTSTIAAAPGTTAFLSFGSLGSGRISTLNLAAGSTLKFGSATDTGVVVLQTAGSVDPTAVIEVAGGTLRDGSGFLTSYTSQVSKTQIDAGATLDLAGASAAILNLQGLAGAMLTTGTSAATVALLESGAFAGVVSGAGGVAKITAGTLTLSGANTYSAGTTVSGGTLVVTNSTRTGGTMTSTGNAAGGTETSSSIGTGGLALGGTLQAGATGLVFSNALTFKPYGGTVDANGKTITLAGAMAFGGTGAFDVTDTSGTNTGVVILTGANASGDLATGFSGATNVLSGTLRTGNTYGFSSQSAYTVAAGAMLDLNGLFQAVGSIAGAGAITSSVGSATGLSTGFDNTSTTFSGVISGGTSQLRLTKYGTGTLTLSGANTYTGPTSIQGGFLQVASDANLGAATIGGAANTLTISNGAGLMTSATFTSNRSVFLGNGNGKIVPATGTTLTLTGTIANQAGQPVALLSKRGDGTLVLTGANTYTGGTFLAQGTLSVGNAQALGTGTLDFEGGTLQASANGLTLANGVTLTTPGTVDTNTMTLGLAGAISGAGALTKIGAGTLILSGADTTTGGTTITAGTLQIGAGGTTGSIAGTIVDNATLAFNRSDAVTFAGAISGTGALTKTGVGTLTLTGANIYTGGTKVVAGTLALTNAGAIGTGGLSLANGTTLSFGGSFTLANATALTGTGDPTIDTGANADTVSGVISGPGALTKIGTGTLTLTAANTYTGLTEVAAGALVVTGSAAGSAFTVDAGASLGGSGAIGGLTVASGATLAPGLATPFSTLSTGNVTFASGSTFTVNVNAAGQTDGIKATGTATIQGGTVNVLAGAGIYSPATTYTLITATSGRTGTFAGLTTTSNLAFLTPTLAYGATTVTLGFTPTTVATVVTPAITTVTPAGVVVTTPAVVVMTPIAFASVAATPNQRASAGAIQTVATASPLYAAVLSQSATGARLAFDAASGEGHASAASALIEDTSQVREAITSRLDAAEREIAPTGPFGALGGAPASPALGYSPVHKGYDTPVAAALSPLPAPAYTLWGSAFGAFGRTRTNGNAAALDRSVGGFVIGGDTRVDAALFSNWRVGVVGGYTSDAIRVAARATSGTVESYFAGLYAGMLIGPLDVKLGVTAGATSIGLRRTVAFPGFVDVTRANYGGTIAQEFGEIGYRFALPRGGLNNTGALGFGAGFVEPVLQAAAIHLDQDGFRERGGSAALTSFGRSIDVETTTLGLKGEVALSDAWPVVARGLLGYRHAFGDVNPKALLAFTSGSTPFVVAGAPIDRDALAAELGLDWRVTNTVTLGLSYAGQYGTRASDSAIRGRAEVKF